MNGRYYCDICDKRIVGKPAVVDYVHGVILCRKCYKDYRLAVQRQEKEIMVLLKEYNKKRIKKQKGII